MAQNRHIGRSRWMCSSLAPAHPGQSPRRDWRKPASAWVCLEQGDWPDYTRARAAFPDFELTSGRDWAWDPNVRAAAGDYPVDDSDSDITALMWNGVGGGTVVYAAHWQRNMPSDFRVHTLDGVADDWPVTYEDLEPFYV